MYEAITYRDTRTNKLYVLNEMVTMGNKVCLVPTDNEKDDKFVAPSTLKRWYSKQGEIPYMVTVKAFTGMKIGVFEARKLEDGNLLVIAKNGKSLIFDPSTDKQINAKNPKFANKLGMTYGWLF